MPQGTVASTQSISSSIKLHGANESFTYYAEANSTYANFNFTLKTASGATVATSTDNATVTNPGGQDYYGSFVVTPKGAAAGDILTWTETPDIADNGDNGYNQVCIQGIMETDITGVPEPSTFYMGFGLLGLVIVPLWRTRRA